MGRLTRGPKPFKTSGLTVPLETPDEEPPFGGWLKEQSAACMQPSPRGEVKTGRLPPGGFPRSWPPGVGPRHQQSSCPHPGGWDREWQQ